MAMPALRPLAIATLAGLLWWSMASAHDYTLGNLTIEHPWARATPGQAKTGAVYVTLVIQGEADRLIAVSSPVAERAALHTHLIEGDIVRMRRIEAVEVSPGEPTVFRPGGHHIMLMGLNTRLVEGWTFPLTLTFAHGGSITVDVIIEKPGAKEPDRKMEHDHNS